MCEFLRLIGPNENICKYTARMCWVFWGVRDWKQKSWAVWLNQSQKEWVIQTLKFLLKFCHNTLYLIMEAPQSFAISKKLPDSDKSTNSTSMLVITPSLKTPLPIPLNLPVLKKRVHLCKSKEGRLQNIFLIWIDPLCK